MIDQKEGETSFAIKIHYDNMVSERMTLETLHAASYTSVNARIDFLRDYFAIRRRKVLILKIYIYRQVR